MKKPNGVRTHEVAPKLWRNTPNLTGDYDLDETLMHRKNCDMERRLAIHLRNAPRGQYGPRSAYSGYSGYHGDD
jgi:hypothetical protein